MNPNEKQVRQISKFLSLVLRHQPDRIGIQPDDGGWISIGVLLDAMRHHGQTISRETLEHVVRSNDKQRFTIDADSDRIRANQGHSIDVELGYKPAEPPRFLLHGTPQQFVEAIRKSGLRKMSRHHVHLHRDLGVASSVGARRGTPVLLKVQAAEMAKEGFLFYVTPNEVWLTDHVPPEFIDFPEDQ